MIAVTYDQPDECVCLASSMRVQTDDRWRLTFVHDGPDVANTRDRLARAGLLQDNRISFECSLVRHDDFGHSNRRASLRNSTADRVILTNADNYYMPVLTEQVLSRTEEFVWWDCVHNYDTPVNHNQSSYGLMCSRLRHGCIDMGVVAVAGRLARQVGFKHTHESADWTYFEQILATNPTTHKINKVMMVHN